MVKLLQINYTKPYSAIEKYYEVSWASTTLSSATKVPALNTHALDSIRKMRNIRGTAIRCTSYTLGKEIVSKERQEVFSSLAMMTD